MTGQNFQISQFQKICKLEITEIIKNETIKIELEKIV